MPSYKELEETWRKRNHYWRRLLSMGAVIIVVGISALGLGYYIRGADTKLTPNVSTPSSPTLSYNPTISLKCSNGIDQRADVVTWHYPESKSAGILPQPYQEINFLISLSRIPHGFPSGLITYIHKPEGEVLRIISIKTSNKSDGALYHIDTDGYTSGILLSGNRESKNLAIYIDLGNKFLYRGTFDYDVCTKSSLATVTLHTTDNIPDLRNKKPLNIGLSEWRKISPLEPTAISRHEGPEVSIYQYYASNISVTEAKNAVVPNPNLWGLFGEIGITRESSVHVVQRERHIAPR